MELQKKDILVLGHTAYKYNGVLYIQCSGKYSGITSIFLRECLKLFGEYEITDSYDIYQTDENGCNDVEFVTNLPWNIYYDL